MIIGKSDQEGWSAICAFHCDDVVRGEDFSANTTTPNPACTSIRAASAVASFTDGMPLLVRRLHISTPSRPVGATTRTRRSLFEITSCGGFQHVFSDFLQAI